MSEFVTIKDTDFIGRPERKLINLDLVKMVTTEERLYRNSTDTYTVVKFLFIDGTKVEHDGTIDDVLDVLAALHRCESDG